MRRRTTVLLLLAALVTALIVWSYSTAPQNASSSRPERVDSDAVDGPRSAPVAPQEHPLPPPADSPYLNTRPDVAYVGSNVCAECHSDQHATYLQTAHSDALAEIDAPSEPPDSVFVHAASHRRYEVHRRDGRLWHTEWASNGKEPDVLLASHPIKYRIGSGNHSRSYLAQVDDFLVESPLTWYASKQAWRMSPGYDRAHHAGFERAADLGCLACHAGRVEPETSRFRVRVHEAAIGCENCHGPGALHVDARRSKAAPSGADLTIVHPGRLPRDRREAICAQCHLRSAATTVVRGRRLADFRPGLRLEDFRVDYMEERPDKSMTVVGHMEQMRASQCYQQSETLTCTTCHDPHAESAAATTEYYRNACLQCHEDCNLDRAQRIKQHANDDCMACHMPKTSTDIPHFAFTHHRISLPATETVDGKTPSQASANLIPTADISHLPTWEQQRCLGLASLEFSEGKPQAVFIRFRGQSLDLLQSVRRRGIDDVEVNAALARLYWEQGRLDLAIDLAAQAAGASTESGGDVNALLVLGDCYLQRNQPQLARGPLSRLTKLRRQSEDWVLLASCLAGLGDLPAAIRACEQAVAIQPARHDARRLLADLYTLRGDASAASRQRDAAVQLQKLAP